MKPLQLLSRHLVVGTALLGLMATGAAGTAWAQQADDGQMLPGLFDQMGPGPGGQGAQGGPRGPGGHGGPGGPMGHGGPEGRHGGPGGMGQHFSERVLQLAKATPEQRQQIRQIMQAARTDIRALREAGRADHQQMRQQFIQPKVDAAAIEALRQKMLSQHDKVSLRYTKALVDAANVLTPEQRQQLGEMAKKRRDMMERHRKERDALMPPPKS